MAAANLDCVCTYCDRPAETLEHCPPRIMLLNKDRPKGWEFPACASCNEGTKDSDQIFALFVYSNILNFTQQEERHFNKIAKGVNNNQGYIIDELLQNASPLTLGSVLLPNTEGPVSITMGPSLQSHIDRIADKLALSAHLIEHNDRASNKSLIWHYWITNEGAMRGEHLHHNLAFTPPRAITQGKKSSMGQFVYQTASTGTGNAAFRFVFQKRVMLVSFLITPPSDDEALLHKILGEGFRRPMTGKPCRPSPISLAIPNKIIRPFLGGRR